MDATNALVKKVQVALKNIIGLDAFVNTRSNGIVIQTRENNSATFVPILQFIYQCEMLTYFSNYIAIILNLANKGKKINWCSIIHYAYTNVHRVDLMDWT